MLQSLLSRCGIQRSFRVISPVLAFMPVGARMLLAMLLALAFLLAGGHWVNNSAAKWLLEKDAEATAVAWAESIERGIGDELAALLERHPPSEKARAILAQSRRIGSVFRYKLFDIKGNLVFISDDLASPNGLEDTLSSHRGNSTIASRILSGGAHVETAQGQPPHRPAYYAEAYVPAHVNGVAIGVAEVYVDQTAKLALFQTTFMVTGAAISFLVLLGSVLPGILAWRRLQERRVAEARVQFLAHHDHLTGLRNRTCFRKTLDMEVSRARRAGTKVAVLALDLDRFKEVNDSLGHAAGDALLQEVARRLLTDTRQEDTVARLGGDEFAVVQVGMNQPTDAAKLADRIIHLLSQPYDLPGGHRVAACGASVGVAIAPTDGGDADTLLKAADAALYSAKADGRGLARFFEAGMDAKLADRRRLTQDLRLAVAEGSFHLAYQPLQSLPAGQLTGFEALLRWSHPERGAVSPAEFIPLAEETGLIIPIGAWVLRQACQDAMCWPFDIKVAVNLSPKQFHQNKVGLLAAVRDALAFSGLPANRLELEVTEGLLLHDTEVVLEMLGNLRALGCSIAMDDFGTGYSSLAYLWRFPFDKLKIDQAFVASMGTEPKAAAIVSTVVALGKALGLMITAEGIETREQAQMLSAAGCQHGQGYLLGRPMPADQALCFAEVSEAIRPKSLPTPQVCKEPVAVSPHGSL